MIKFRLAELKDIKQIQQVEKEYYEGFNCPEKTLRSWIKGVPENFIIAQNKNKIIAFIFFEYLNRIKTIPFIHKTEHKNNGKYVYISEIGVLNKYNKTNILQKLFNKVLEKSKRDKCKKIIWLTGLKSKHDKIESRLLSKNKFAKKEKVKHWEAYPNHFVNDHFIWVKKV